MCSRRAADARRGTCDARVPVRGALAGRAVLPGRHEARLAVRRPALRARVARRHRWLQSRLVRSILTSIMRLTFACKHSSRE